ncbi:MAG: hypothetical protein WAU47_07035, partial [Desulfobaccales bacterium]
AQQLTAESCWRRLLAQEQAKEFQEVWKTGLTLVNLFPHAPQRGAVLLKLGELAKTQGKTAQALELYSLVSFLNPGAPEAAQAHVAASSLELSRDLKKKNPLQTMHLFLNKISHLNPGHQAEVVQEALVAGWEEVSLQARTTSPLPLSLVEELLALWDKQPPKMRPSEGAFLLADLLNKAGLCEEAQVLQAKAQEKNRNSRHLLGKLHSLTGTLTPVLLREEHKLALFSWLTPWQVPFNGEALLNWFFPPRAHADWFADPAPGMDQALLYSSPSSPPPAGLDQTTTATAIDKDSSPFIQDRLGLSHLQEGQPEAAQATFQDLARHHDPFWQRLAQVRLADLELARLKTEPAP